MALVCENPNISAEDWLHCLIEIDQCIMELKVASDNVIIISLPYPLKDTKAALLQFISDTFAEESMLFCTDMIIEFVVPSKVHIHNMIKMNDTSPKNEPTQKITWTNDEYDKLISVNSLIIINIETLTFIVIPRNVHSLYKSWRISWDDAMDGLMNQIFQDSDIRCIKDHFELDWSLKIDYSDVTICGYLCDDGMIVKAEVLNQITDNGRIFVQFRNVDGFKRFGWFDTPNSRFRPPSAITAFPNFLD